MRKFNTLVIAIFITLSSSCTNKTNTKSNSDVHIINVEISSEQNTFIYSDYFNDVEIIALETNNSSLIGNINRISFYNNNIYILDKQSNSVLIFNINGSFLNKINNVGMGPGEYTQIGDFDIDRDNNRILVYAHSPMKLIYYDLECNFIKEERINDIYRNILSVKNGVVLIDIDASKKRYAWMKSEDSEKLKSYVDIPDYILKFHNKSTMYPMVCTSKEAYFYSPLDYNIYTCSEKGVFPKYRLDFGKNNIDINHLKSMKESEIKNFYQTLKEKNYAFFISNFRETEDYLVFKFEPNNLVFYNKNNMISELFSYQQEDMTALGMGEYFAHDGIDNNFITIVQPHRLLKQFELSNWNLEPYREHFPYFHKLEPILETITENSNPIVAVYKIK